MPIKFSRAGGITGCAALFREALLNDKEGKALSLHYYLKAAEARPETLLTLPSQGFGLASMKIAELYENGHTVPRNEILASHYGGECERWYAH